MNSTQLLKATEQIWYQRTETVLHESITQGEYPFLGLYSSAFSVNAREFLNKQIKHRLNPVSGYIQGLRQWPAIYACYLTLHVAESYGNETGHSVYPAISKAVTANKKELTTQDREALWLAYRLACIKLGLTVSSRQSGSNYMINEYLQQSGVPLNYVEDLVKRMIRHAKKIGLPTDDNPQAIRQWTSSFVERLKAPVSVTVRNAIENDENGFYLQLFLKLVHAPESHNPDSELEVSMVKAIVESEFNDLSISNQLLIPRLLWLDNGFTIELPSGEHNVWEIKLDDDHFAQNGQYDPLLIPLNNNIYRSIEISENQSNTLYRFNLWQDHKDNRLLVFSANGEFLKEGQLSRENLPLALEPGNYQLITRFKPKGKEEIEEISEDPTLYSMSISLFPDQELILERGPASIMLKGDSKPFLYFKGENYRDTKGHEIYASSRLIIGAKIPKDYLNQANTLILKLIPGDLGEAVDIIINNFDDQQVEWDIGTLAKQWNPGVSRLLIELKREDIARPMARTSFLFWNGLDTVENSSQFYCDRLPENLLLEESENTQLFRRTISYKDGGNRFFRMCFELKRRKTINFSWFVPGIFMNLKEFSDNKACERVLQKNSILTVNTLSRSLLEIYSSTPGVLQLGDFKKKLDHKNKIVRLHLSSLVEYLKPECSTLQFFDADSNIPEPLLNLVTPHELLSFKVSKQAVYLNVCISLNNPIQAFRLNAIDELTGRSIHLELIPDDMANNHNAGNLVNVITTSKNKEILHYSLECPTKNWEAGAWLITIDVKINSHWGFLCNARQDHYAFSLLLNAQGGGMLLRDIEASLALLSTRELLPILRRIHQTLLTCYTQESWSEISWLSRLWSYIVSRFTCQDGELLLESLQLAAKYPPDATSSGWVPILSLSAVIPWIFSRPARSYKGFGHRKDSLLLVFKVFEKLANGVTELFKNATLDTTIVPAFSNIAEIMKGSEPKNFSMKNYEESLKSQDISSRLRLLHQEDWKPDVGDYLGALHYRWATKKFQESYIRTSLGNDLRRTTSLGLIKNCSRQSIANVCNSELPDSFKLYSLGLLDSLSDDDIELLKDEDAQLRENYLDMISFLSLFAQVCRYEARYSGVLELFIKELNIKTGMDKDDIRGSLGYLLFIGEDIFAFYLLLWEIVFQADWN